MKYLGYIAIPIDLLLGNYHWFYVMYPNTTEWYTSDVAEFTRVSLWIFIALFWLRSFKPENWTIAWYGICTLWDVWQVADYTNGTETSLITNVGDSSLEIMVFVIGAIIIHLIHIFKGNGRTAQGT